MGSPFLLPFFISFPFALCPIARRQLPLLYRYSQGNKATSDNLKPTKANQKQRAGAGAALIYKGVRLL